MAQQEYIKHLWEQEDFSVNGIANHMNINWRTANKYAKKDNWNTEIKKRKAHHPILKPFLEIIDTWLEEDLTKPKKQRHTQTRIYRRLVEECNYTGGIRTVTGYVSERWKGLTKPTKYIDLQHPGGEAQVDFGTAEVSYEQKMIQIKYLVMSFPYSNAAYVWFTPSENIECFLTGLQELFQLVGYVPRKIWFDNLSAAVVKVENYHKRKTTKKFAQFALHYGFQHEFCGVGKGHEKGNVENKVGCTRRNWMVPIPSLISWDDINKQMLERAEQYLNTEHYEKKQPIHVLFAEEKAKMLQLPNEPFEVYRLEAAKLDKYGRVQFEGQKFSIAKANLNSSALLKIHWDEVEVLGQDYAHLGTFPRPHSFKEREIDWPAELAVIHKKPKAVTYAWIYSQLPLSLQCYVAVAEPNKRKLRIGWLLKWLDSGHSIDEIAQAVEHTSAYQHDQEGVIYHALYQVLHPVANMESLEEVYTPNEVRDYEPDQEVYNQLSKGGVAI